MFSEIIDLYKNKKSNIIKMNNDIIRATNYKTFRALESDDFIVNGYQLSPDVIIILNAMYKSPVFSRYQHENTYKYDIIAEIIKKYNV